MKQSMSAGPVMKSLPEAPGNACIYQINIHFAGARKQTETMHRTEADVIVRGLTPINLNKMKSPRFLVAALSGDQMTSK